MLFNMAVFNLKKTNSRRNLTSQKYDLRGKKVAIFGLGILGGGEACVRYVVKAGAKVFVIDDKPRKNFYPILKRLAGLPVKFAFGPSGRKLLTNCDIIIKNPGVDPKDPLLQRFKKLGKLITSDISLFRSASQNPVLAVTGTKGKTTTANWLGYLLKEKFSPVVAGNLKISPLSQKKAFDKKTPVILELSSFQLADLTLPLAAKIVIVTNLYSDHLNRHETMKEYAKEKVKIFSGQGKNDITILPLDSEWQKFSKIKPRGKIYRTSLDFHPRASAWIENKSVFVKMKGSKKPIVNLNKCKLQDYASWRNAVNVALVGHLLGLPANLIRRKILNFKGVEERFEIIRKYKKRTFINNTTATNPIAAEAGLKSLCKNNILIFGGSDKKLKMDNFAKLINLKSKIAIALPGSATDRIWSRIKIKKIKAGSMQKAVQLAWQLSQPADIIILNPGAASFGLFKNEFDRGRQFTKAVKKIR
ncbi:MAG: UDP-N-acetylmuramoyl-L-alanine--D-glutamate ligase [Candidatus Kerfeldbacteria bacterium CG08_land_8_20_14_0_20_43_14]|uniref:UDP-N-acetylmuramoylalanine--D-glutamate ligase n=1 Tax=Candidatus Kerfeldbacteria bacterium CG08_land_8_20_14_0_20_43_14 TaxID=2014246 RepID=A0A2H0YR45_9BACT|nr:MAG: UDP-N-acetylmuramoyl-L-alanine--D-glutamate ligase [Candidatus Kerfeldbacteria bacterium CG08_land_8_20_14_0_20_43_14]